MKTLLNVAVGIGLIIVGFLGGQVLRIKSDPVLKLGLPGGGHHSCCWRPGTYQSLPACGSFPITQQNYLQLCQVCTPSALWC